MGASGEYYLRLQEEEFNRLETEEQSRLYYLGMQYTQKPTQEDEKDETYNKLRKTRIESWNKEQEYLFKKRNNIQH